MTCGDHGVEKLLHSCEFYYFFKLKYSRNLVYELVFLFVHPKTRPPHGFRKFC